MTDASPDPFHYLARGFLTAVDSSTASMRRVVVLPQPDGTYHQHHKLVVPEFQVDAFYRPDFGVLAVGRKDFGQVLESDGGHNKVED